MLQIMLLNFHLASKESRAESNLVFNSISAGLEATLQATEVICLHTETYVSVCKKMDKVLIQITLCRMSLKRENDEWQELSWFPPDIKS